MHYFQHYQSPLGGVLMAADHQGVTGLWFEGAKYFAQGLERNREQRETPHLAQTRAWLDAYFAGRQPDFTPALHLQGTPFQQLVWSLMLAIPYGSTTTYGALTKQVSEKMGGAPMCAQAVGGTVGRNPISLIVPCHRVVGKSGSLTGYAGGLQKKMSLLQLEGADMSGLFVPRRSAAL